jgi:PAS domain S-box-containing protein
MKSDSSMDIKEHKKVEEKLKESEEKYRYLMDGITSVGIGIDIVTKDYKVLFQNQVLKEKFGDITGKLCYEEYMGLKAPCDFCPMIKALKNNTIESTELIGVDGSNYELFSAPYLDSDRTSEKAIEIVMNITERKQAEMALRESEEKYRSLFNSAQVGLYWSRISDGKFLECNDTFAKLFGYDTREECLADYIALEHYVDLNTRNEMLEEIRDNKEVKNYEIHVTKRDGTPIWLSISARMFEKENRIEGAAIDITEQKIAEGKLKESEEKYRTILEGIKEGYFEVDLYGNFEFFNNSLCEIVGYSKNELLSMNYENLCDEENKRFIFQTYNNLYKEGKGSTLFDFVQIKKNGERVYEESSIYLKFNSQGEIIGFKGLIRDISERKKGEILKRKFTKQLEKEVQYRTKELNDASEKQKLYLDQIVKSSRFKTEFLATMSHELRTPLNAIIGFTDLLLEGVFGKLNEEQLEYIKDIDESSNHLLDMITNILDISRIESGQVTLTVEEINLNNLINHVISTLKPLYNEKELIIDLKGLKKEQLIFADRIKFKQIIYNLLSNAIKFTEKGKVTFEFKDNKNTWDFIVKDTGIGIAEKDFNIIFKDFKRVKSAYVDSILGSGLGLALTKRIVNLHGGNILFTSNLGKGTTFTFTIPKNLKKKVNSEKKVESFLSKL